ncbi:MAG: undecaprenyl-diphosphate phosphatase [Spirochaetales bacterium]|nr:MAG: undecaprenyl-diphosphate phosphatase [Spirochaetales bacterium]
MSTLQAFVLGLFQGVAEFLPISSSGHLLVFKDLMGLAEVPALFDVVLHVATLFSILVVFRRRVFGIIRSIGRWMLRSADVSDAVNLAIVPPAIVATALTAIVGYAASKIDLSAKPAVVAGLFIVTALILIGSSFPRGTDGYRDLRFRHGLITGIAQGIGVFPGISRSGITISAGLAAGMKREEAGEFAFLLAIPAILGALVLQIKDMGDLAASVAPLQLVTAALSAFLSGIAALMILLPIVRKGRLAWFAVYLIPAGILGLFIL